MNSGCHVLVEKPVTLNSKEVSHMKQTAEIVKVNFMAGHVLLFHPAIKKMKEIIESSMIGDLQYIYSLHQMYVNDLLLVCSLSWHLILVQ